MLVEWATVLTSSVQKYIFLVMTRKTDGRKRKKAQSALHWSQHNRVCWVQSPGTRQACAPCREQNAPITSAQASPPIPAVSCWPGQNGLLGPQIASPWLHSTHSSMGSTPVAPTGFLEPPWDSDATTAAPSIIFYPNWFKVQPMLKSTGTRRFF